MVINKLRQEAAEQYDEVMSAFRSLVNKLIKEAKEEHYDDDAVTSAFRPVVNNITYASTSSRTRRAFLVSFYLFI